MTLANLIIYYTWKNIKSECNNNKFNILAPTWNDAWNDLPDESYSISGSQYCFEFIIKKHEIFAKNPLIQIYPNKIKNKRKAGYKFELPTPETMKLLGNTKKTLIKIKMEKMYQN